MLLQVSAFGCSGFADSLEGPSTVPTTNAGLWRLLMESQTANESNRGKMN